MIETGVIMNIWSDGKPAAKKKTENQNSWSEIMVKFDILVSKMDYNWR